MASVFKLGRDKKKRNSIWYFEYQDHQGKKRMRKGFTDKSLTEQLAVKLETEAPLFPKLAKRRTWLMVKKDLERAGIAYQTDEGIADFHAAGRHTHITELLRNGASLPEAKELARHTDVNMTMRYTHIGIHDQARALRALQMPCQDIVRKSADSERPSLSPDDTGSHSEEAGSDDASPCDLAPCDTKKQKRASDDSDAQKWRRRESNPRPVTHPGKLLRV